MTGVNYLNEDYVRSATCKRYAIDGSSLVTIRQITNPVDFSDKSHWSRSLVRNLEREENIVTQKRKKTRDSQIFDELIRLASKDSGNSLEAVIASVSVAGKCLGPRASEYSQSRQDEVDYH
jgi:hypothetical protein